MTPRQRHLREFLDLCETEDAARALEDAARALEAAACLALLLAFAAVAWCLA